MQKELFFPPFSLAWVCFIYISLVIRFPGFWANIPKQALTGVAQSAPAPGGRDPGLTAFLDSVKQGKIAGLALPLTGEHRSQHTGVNPEDAHYS